jgi:DNA helicase IV
VISEAVRRRQRTIPHGKSLDVEGTTIKLLPHHIRDAREKARRSRAPHNEARKTFVSEVIRELLRALARARNVELEQETRETLLAELYGSKDVRREINLCWMPLSPERLLRDLFADPQRLAEAGVGLTREERQRLRRDRSAPWSVADIPLLDEAAELLGEDNSAVERQRALAEAERRAEVEYARQVQETFGGAEFGTAEELAARYAERASYGTVAEQAYADRSWAFGHVVVDEAQELSPMAWRLLMRRCPSRSFTVVGDIAQTSSAAGARSWRDVFTPHVADRWRQTELTVNYRTPQQVMDLAAAVLAAGGSTVTAPTSARVGRRTPAFTRLAPDPVAGTPDLVGLSRIVADEYALAQPGTLAVITTRAAHAAVAAAISAALPPGTVAADSAATSAPVSVLTVADAKGLEFDTLVLLEPEAIRTEGIHGLHDLYVAMTRPTQQLHVVHAGILPPGLQS